MSEDLSKIYEQALVSVLTAAEQMGLNIDELYQRATELTEQEESTVRFIDSRDTGEVALATTLAIARVKGLVP
ncbi:Uncharacterized protein AC504_2433 [Pseudomonas syringae pv. maculicola]|uniref:Uncharacterized protein n=1 Tax=Pseudomonas savastanoi pv. glycinea TaxID=318 RepID=A0A3M4YC66_PSESG|nr:hypothetical protein [Pseudomonas savastanoi]KPB87067.1 Uncharacterized protein AC504_2433 [Pseudomonas syringae pv. maculicola]MBN4175027.1 hypothetical protein [Pseudomonas savastanoi pv. phaseolicola]RMM67124.1 hypothetical protein ALQ73_01802 [Pseudomonas savastanoi pv. glycinea]RMR86244.1 hypothetical protein ALP76_01805 [Pseudomonas savastanoi pv. glycinea]